MRKCDFLILTILVSVIIGISYAFNISPHRYELTVSPGKSYKVEFKITNVYNYAISIEPSFYDKILPEKQNSKISSKKWIKEITPKKFVLKPKETKKVKVKISIPKEMTGHSAAMISFPIEKVEQKNLPFQLVVSVPIYIAVKK